jgi:hypothetical protein
MLRHATEMSACGTMQLGLMLMSCGGDDNDYDDEYDGAR